MRILLSCLLLLLFVPPWMGAPRLPLMGERPVVYATLVTLDPAHPALRRVGALTFIGGVHLTSPDPAFGGFSSLYGDGRRLTLLSDGGNIVRLAIDTRGQPQEVSFGDLPAGPGFGRAGLRLGQDRPRQRIHVGRSEGRQRHRRVRTGQHAVALFA